MNFLNFLMNIASSLVKKSIYESHHTFFNIPAFLVIQAAIHCITKLG